MNKQYIQGLSTPTAILLVGVLIAAAIFFGGSDSTLKSPVTDSAPSSAELAQIDTVAVKGLLEELDIDQDDLEACLADGEAAALVEADFQEGVAAGVRGTPYSLVVDTVSGATIPVNGGQPFDAVKPLIDAILEDNPEIAQASVDTTISTDISNDYLRGNEDARIVVIEFSDIECPFCARFHDTMKQVLAEYPDDVAWVYRHFPLDQIHPNARRAAAAVECIGEEQGADAYWTALDAMFANPALPKSL